MFVNLVAEAVEAENSEVVLEVENWGIDCEIESDPHKIGLFCWISPDLLGHDVSSYQKALSTLVPFHFHSLLELSHKWAHFGSLTIGTSGNAVNHYLAGNFEFVLNYVWL